MRYTFEDYDPGTPSQERALAVAMKITKIAIAGYTGSQESEPAIVVFSGQPGVGKTHLIEAIKGELDASEVSYDTFSGFITPSNEKSERQVVIGDDAFSRYKKLDALPASGSYMELLGLNHHILNSWYPNGSLVVMSSNFALIDIQANLTELDSVGRASSRLCEMALRGADVPIIGDDHRSSADVVSLF